MTTKLELQQSINRLTAELEPLRALSSQQGSDIERLTAALADVRLLLGVCESQRDEARTALAEKHAVIIELSKEIVALRASPQPVVPAPTSDFKALQQRARALAASGKKVRIAGGELIVSGDAA